MTAEDPAGLLKQLADKIDRLERVVSGRLLPPVRQVTLAEAVKLGFPRRTLERAVAQGVFTDYRARRRRGAPIRLYQDELEAYRTDGEAGVCRLRHQLGRD